MAGTDRHAVHRTMVLVDVEGFGSPARTLPHQLGTRAGMYDVVAEAFGRRECRGRPCYHEDRGDSVLVLVPPEYPKAPLVEVLPEALARAVRGYNTTSAEAARARLRLAVHAGEVAFTDRGVTSTSLTTAFRLLDAPPLKRAPADSPGVVAVIVSRLIFDDVVRHAAAIDPAARDSGDPDLRRAVVEGRGVHQRRTGRFEEAVETFDASVAAGIPSPLARAATLSNRGNALVNAGRYPEGIANLETAVAVCRVTPPGTCRSSATCTLLSCLTVMSP